MIKSIGKLLVVPSILFIAVSAYAWTEPTLAPTGGNVTAPLRLDSNGRLGIGTASPGYRFTVSDPAGGTTLNLIDLDGQTNAPDLRFGVGSDGSHNGAAISIFAYGRGSGTEDLRTEFQNWGGVNSWGYVSQSGGTKVVGALDLSGSGATGNTEFGRFRLYSVSDAQGGYSSGTSAGTEAVRLSADPAISSFINGGNFGIGTTNPVSTLHAKGITTVEAGNVSTTGGGEPTYTGQLRILGNSTQSLSQNLGLEFKAAASGSGYGFRISNPDLGSANTPLVFEARRGSAAWTEYMRLTNQGNLGVGTTNPTYKVDVTGDINVSGCFRVAGTCIGAGGSVGGSGTANKIPKWVSSSTLGDSTMTITAGGSIATPQWVIAGGSDPAWGNAFEVHNTSWVGGGSNGNYGTIAAGHGYYYNGLQSGGNTGTEAGDGQLYVSGTSKLLGNVGVGTETPAQKVTIAQTSAGWDAGLGLNYNGHTWRMIADGDGSTLTIAPDSDYSKGIIDKGGNVGIGTNNPSAKLQVAGQILAPNSPNSTWGDVTGGTFNSNTVYAYTAICTSNNSGACSSTGGTVLGINNTSAKNNIPDSGNVFFNNGGNVGIGTNGPSRMLDVAGTAKIGTNASGIADESPYTLVVRGNAYFGDNSANGNVQAQSFYENVAANNNVSASTVCRSLTTGQIGGCTSLAKYKTDIAGLNLGLNTVMQLHPVTFDWKDPNMGGHDLGFIADEVEKVNPLLTEHSATTGELTGVKYSQMSAVLVKAVQELNTKVDKLQAENDDLKARIEALEAKIK